MTAIVVRTGRPTKATPVTLARIVQHVRGGMSLKSAAHLEGVETRTVNEWRQVGRGGDDAPEPFRSFALDVARAEAEYEREHLDHIAAAAVPGEHSDGDYRASQWILERTRPETYAPSLVIMEKAQESVMDALLDALQSKLSPSAWAEVVDALGMDAQPAAIEAEAE